ncbi:unnamed protein product, partial [Ectocarpus sp. 12 AP-2014]
GASRGCPPCGGRRVHPREPDAKGGLRGGGGGGGCRRRGDACRQRGGGCGCGSGGGNVRRILFVAAVEAYRHLRARALTDHGSRRCSPPGGDFRCKRRSSRRRRRHEADGGGSGGGYCSDGRRCGGN